jgi:hypothetical protein
MHLMMPLGPNIRTCKRRISRRSWCAVRTARCPTSQRLSGAWASAKANLSRHRA